MFYFNDEVNTMNYLSVSPLSLSLSLSLLGHNVNELCFRQSLPLKQRMEAIAAAVSTRLDAFSSSVKDDVTSLDDELQNAGEMKIP